MIFEINMIKKAVS